MASHRDDDTLEWTVSEAGFDDEASPAVPEPLPAEAPVARPPKPARPNWRVALFAIIPVLLVLAVVWGSRPTEDSRLIAQIEDSLRNSWPPPFTPFGVTGTTRASAEVRAVLANSEPDHVLVELAYTFTGPGDRQLHFGAWRYFNTEANSVSYARDLRSQLGERREFRGQRLTLSYGEADAAIFTPGLLAHLDDILVRACVDWECPSDLRLEADATWQKPFGMSSVKRNTALTMALAEIGAMPEAGDSSIWPSPHLSGYPLDEPTTEYYQRTLAIYALTRLAHRLVPREADGWLVNNAFFYALVAREAARVGIEPPITLAVRPLPMTTDWYGYWGSGPTWRSAGAQPALNTLNALLQNQPVAVEAELLRRLATSDPMSWLAYPYIRAGLAPELFFNRLRAAQGQAEVETVKSLAGVEVVLNCNRSPQIVVDGRVEDWSPLWDVPIGVAAQEWSPGGNHLLLAYGGQPLLADARTGELKWLRISDSQAWANGWVNDSVIALRVGGDVNDAGTTWLDLTDPSRTFPHVPPAYALSRDRSRAVTWEPIPNSTHGVIRVMDDPVGGPGRAVATGMSPALSPNGDRLAYIRLNTATNRLALAVMNLASGEEQFIWENTDIGVSDPPPQFLVAWSPTSDWIALRAEQPQGNVIGMANLLIRADGSVTVNIPINTWIDSTTLFSADGRYIAFLNHDAAALPTLEVWELPTGNGIDLQRVWDWPAVQNFQWGPTGHELLVFTDQWTGLLREPREGERPYGLNKSQCWSAAWK